MDVLLEAAGLSRRYGRRVAVRDASLVLRPGAVACLTGGNGAGKTTLLAMLAGVAAPDSGHVLLAGRRLDIDHAARQRLGYMADTPLVYEALTARENLRFFARLYGAPGDAAHINALLDRVGLAARADDPAGDYSAGLRRRLDLARAVLHRPDVLVLDEPATALDAAGLDVLRSLLAEWRTAGRAAIFSTHDAAALAGCFNEALSIADGRLSDEVAVRGAASEVGRR
jgi:heme ABC exporter ATP-binding subunit CcmA